ncbi:MAG: SprT family zinc-dependent metalloprotease [Pseudomonadota bacterium]|nr:SprT family zinc-dependent metalloprotease [Pseudomonadota bacterium]
MARQIRLGTTVIDVAFKKIRNVHLSVHPPTGRISISAPEGMSMDTLRVFAIRKLTWIKQQQGRIRRQEREPPREFLDRESHFVWGRRYLLKLASSRSAPSIELKHRTLLLHAHPDSDRTRKEAALDAWYRRQLRDAASPIIRRWQQTIGVVAHRVYVQRMKTKWGSCNPKARSIRLNSELAKKPPECLEYIIVHELLHLIEPTHNERFIALMDRYMPHWPAHRDRLNQVPLRHEEWSY